VSRTQEDYIDEQAMDLVKQQEATDKERLRKVVGEL